MHQPPNPDDLRRAPPASGECARIRGLLRDFADGDLSAVEHRQVEEHVHVCFACSVELSRAEHEVLRLRRAFAGGRRELRRARLGPDFPARVVDAILESEGAASGEDAELEATDGEAGGSGPATAGAAARSARNPTGRRAAHPRSLVWSFAALVACFLGFAMWTVAAEQEPGQSARLVVMGANRAFGDAGRRLFVGDGLGDAEGLKVRAGGSARFDWHDLSANSQPAATLAMDGEGRLRLENGAPLLLDGTVRIETRRPVRIPVADGSEIELGVGDYVISADVALAEERYLPTMLDPMTGAPADLQIQIEVLRGDTARIVRDVGPTLVDAGSVGVYAGGSAVTVLSSGVQVAGADSGARSTANAPPPVAQAPTLLTSVYHRSGLPSVGTTVVAAFAANGVSNLRVGVTDAYGDVTIASDAPCEGDFAVLHALPAQMEYGLLAPDAVPLLRDGVQVRSRQSLVLDLAEPLRGQIVDATGQPRLGVRVLPCVVDELFDHVFPLLHNQGVTDEQGRFVIHRLAAALPPHQHLAVLLVHPQLEAAVVPVPARGSANALQPLPPIMMRGLRNVKLEGFPPLTQITIWEDVRTMEGRAVVQRQFQTNQNGHVPNAAIGHDSGNGNLWAIGGSSSSHVRPLVSGGLWGSPPLERFYPAQNVPIESCFGPLDNVPGTDLYIGASYRHQQFAVAPAPNAGNGITMVVKDGLGRPLSGAHVFAITPTAPRMRAETRFLGLTTSQGVISLEPVRYQGDLAVVSPDGSVRFVAQPQEAFPLVDATLEATGRVLLGPSLRPDPIDGAQVVRLTFRRQFEELQGIEVFSERFASEATGWEFTGLIPGFYMVSVDGVTHPIDVPAGGLVVLQ